MATEKQQKTFLSYSRFNKDFAIKLAKELKSEGFDIWLDQLDIPAGTRWDREVEKALKESEIFMIILTPTSVDSENVLDEIGYAIDNGKRFLPVLLENCDVPLRLRRFQYVDFTNKDFDDGVESAKDLLRALIAQTTIPGRVIADQQVEADRKAKEEVDHREKEEAEHLAGQKSKAERLAKTEMERTEKVKVEPKPEKQPGPVPSTTSITKVKMPMSKGGKAGVGVVLLLILGLLGTRIFSSPPEEPYVEAPVATEELSYIEAATEAPTATEAPAATELPISAISVVVFDGGQFVQTGATLWEEQGSGGAVFSFEEVNRDETTIYIFDAGRNLTLHLNIIDGTIYYDDGESFFALFTIIEVY